MLTTESLLLVALGFGFAVVLAMIFGFSIWSAANSWASFRRRREVPTTILDMQAEREALRAQNAMTARRLQFQLEEARSQWAERTAQVTRHRNRAIVMAKDLIAKDAEIASLRALAAELTGETNRRAKIIARLTGHEAVKLRSFDMPVPEGTMPAARAAAAPERSESSGDGAPIDRIKAKIAELNALSAQIASEQGGDAVGDEPAVRSARTGPEPMTLTALREAEAELAAPLEPEALPEKTLDEVGEVVLPPPLPEPAPLPPPERPLTLAEKFKALREGMNG